MKKDKVALSITERPLFYWVFKDNLKLQIILLIIIIVVVFARVIPLEMQKRIINDSIALQNIKGLFLYCAIYIVAITLASALKLAINYLQAIIGEKAITTMRKELYQHILTLPLDFFRTTQPGMVVASLMNELSTAGTFAGMAFAVPVTNILTLLAFAGYLFWLNPKLAGAILLIYPVVVLVLPFLQKKANKANKKRVDISRSTANQIAESISAINEIQIHGAYDQEGRKFNFLAEKLRKIRIRWSLFRFGIKTANNYFIGLGPFVIFIFGGYLVMHGQLALGAMVAFLSAQEKLYDPWKELIDFYQTYQDASVGYYRTMEYFNTLAEFSLEPVEWTNEPLAGNLEVKNLFYETADGHRLLNGISFSLAAGQHLAVVGYSGGGKSTLIQAIGKMFAYTSGSIQIDGRELSTLPKKEIVRNLGYISQNPFIFTGSIEDNLIYAYNAALEAVVTLPTEENSIDLDRMILVLQQVGLFVDVIRFGLDSVIDPGNEEITAKIIAARYTFRKEFGDQLADYVEFYNPDKYHRNSSVAENIIFGTTTNENFGYSQLPDNPQFRSFLKDIALLEPLFNLGIELATQAVDILAGVDSVDLFFKNSPVPADKIEECEKLLARLKKHSLAALSTQQQTFLLSLALNFTPSIHTMSRLPAELKDAVLAARKVFPERYNSLGRHNFTAYCETCYIAGQSILNNIFFGRIKPGLSQAQDRVNQSIMHLLVEEDFLEKIAAFGLQFQVGSMGDRLSGGQRQKLAIARVLLKQPKIILMDEATSALDNKSQSRIQRLMASRWKGKRTIIAAVHRLDTIGTYDKVAVMKAGKLVEFGTYDELIDQKGILHELIYGRKQSSP